MRGRCHGGRDQVCGGLARNGGLGEVLGSCGGSQAGDRVQGRGRTRQGSRQTGRYRQLGVRRYLRQRCLLCKGVQDRWEGGREMLCAQRLGDRLLCCLLCDSLKVRVDGA